MLSRQTLFAPSAHLYDDLYGAQRDYMRQARQIVAWISARHAGAKRLLDVACGTGRLLAHLRSVYGVEGVDACPTMVRLARRGNPGIPFYVGGMQRFTAPGKFDAITCLGSSITYANSIPGLNATLMRFASHLRPGGICIVEPFIPPGMWRDGRRRLLTAERPDKTIAMVDRSVRTGRQVRREIAYVVSTTRGLECIREIHRFYLFSTRDYERAFASAGFRLEFLRSGFDPERGILIGTLVETKS